MGRTLPYAHMTTEDYGRRMSACFDNVAQEQDPPTHEQLRVLWHVSPRVLQKVRYRKEQRTTAPPGEEPLRGLQWLRIFFEEALGWTHGQQFFCMMVFQNRNAATIGGVTDAQPLRLRTPPALRRSQ